MLQLSVLQKCAKHTPFKKNSDTDQHNSVIKISHLGPLKDEVQKEKSVTRDL